MGGRAGGQHHGQRKTPPKSARPCRTWTEQGQCRPESEGSKLRATFTAAHTPRATGRKHLFKWTHQFRPHSNRVSQVFAKLHLTAFLLIQKCLLAPFCAQAKHGHGQGTYTMDGETWPQLRCERGTTELSGKSLSGQPEGFVGTQVHLLSGRWCCLQALGWCRHRAGTVCPNTQTHCHHKGSSLCTRASATNIYSFRPLLLRSERI